MSSKTTSPDVPVDQPSTDETSTQVGAEPVPTGEELPFESPEFGVGSFFPHLDTPADA